MPSRSPGMNPPRMRATWRPDDRGVGQLLDGGGGVVVHRHGVVGAVAAAKLVTDQLTGAVVERRDHDHRPVVEIGVARRLSGGLGVVNVGTPRIAGAVGR